MYVGDAKDAQDDAVRAPASGRKFFFRDDRRRGSQTHLSLLIPAAFFSGVLSISLPILFLLFLFLPFGTLVGQSVWTFRDHMMPRISRSKPADKSMLL